MDKDDSPETLLDILDLIGRIEAQTSTLDHDSFCANLDVQDATAYRLLAIGEVSKGLSEALKSRHAHIPWRQILAMRNFLAHEYFMRESDIIWNTVTLSLPQLRAVVQAELDDLTGP